MLIKRVCIIIIMKCRKFLGNTICKVNSATVDNLIYQLPKVIDKKIPTTIYTASNCSSCLSTLNKNLKQLKPLKHLIQPSIIDVIVHPNLVDPKIIKLPSIKIGDHVLINSSELEILETLKKQIDIKKLK